MHILASSLINVANTFLHAGYISASEPENYLGLSCNSLDTALPGAASIATLTETSEAAVSVAGSSGSMTALVLGVVCFIGTLAGIYIFRSFRSRAKRSPG